MLLGFFILLIVLLALRFTSKLTIDKPPENIAHNRSEENRQTFSGDDLRTRSEDWEIAGNGHGKQDGPGGDDFRPRFPFFTGNPGIFLYLHHWTFWERSCKLLLVKLPNRHRLQVNKTWRKTISFFRLQPGQL